MKPITAKMVEGMAELPFHSRRSCVVARRGMVASSQPLASQAGLRILQSGGSAADAAVAVAAALNVTEPCSTGLGGDAFLLYYSAEERRVHCLMGNGASPAALSLEAVRARGYSGRSLPPFHALCVSVPGAAALWEDTLKAWGRLPLAQVLQPAIELAEGGFPVAPITSKHWCDGAGQLRRATADGGDDVHSNVFLTPSGDGPGPGYVMTNADLAHTMRLLGEHGAKKGFYSGPVADAIVDAVQKRGGVLTHEDLAEHHTRRVEPLCAQYRGYNIFEAPPPTQGIAALVGLTCLQEAWHSGAPPCGSAASQHARAEAMRVAFVRALAHVGDTERVDVPVAQLLDRDATARHWRSWFRPDAVGNVPRDGFPLDDGDRRTGGDTVYFCVVDGNGNAASFINSNYMGFGTGIVPKGCGFSLQNRAHNFLLDPGHPNCLAPRTRPYHTIIPGMATHADGQLMMAFGVMGGFMQPQGHLQVVSNIVDYGMDPQSALDAPRFCWDGVDSSVGPASVATAKLLLEEGVDEGVADALQALGHAVVHPVTGHTRAVFGRGQIIVRDTETGVLWGGSDPRADGLAIGF